MDLHGVLSAAEFTALLLLQLYSESTEMLCQAVQLIYLDSAVHHAGGQERLAVQQQDPPLRDVDVDTVSAVLTQHLAVRSHN